MIPFSNIQLMVVGNSRFYCSGNIISLKSTMIKRQQKLEFIIKREEGRLQEEEEAQKQDSHQKKKTKTQNIMEEYGHLFAAKERFRRFVDQLGHFKDTPIRAEILLYYYARNSKKKFGLTSTVINPLAILASFERKIKKLITLKKKYKDNWLSDEVHMMLWIVSKYFDLHDYSDFEKDMTDEDWNMVASIIPGVTAQSCKYKWLSFKKVTLHEYEWTTEEEDLLKQIVIEKAKQNMNLPIITGKEWKQISLQLYQKNKNIDKVYRSTKLCREHWNLFLKAPKPKTQWQPAEDYRLLKLIVEKNGKKKWSIFLKFFPLRSENGIKNRYQLLLDKKMRKNGKQESKTELELILNYLDVLDKEYPELSLEYKPEPQAMVEEEVQYLRFENMEVENEENHQESAHGFGEVKVQKINFFSSEEPDHGCLPCQLQPGQIKTEVSFTKKEDSGEVNYFELPESDRNLFAKQQQNDL